MSSKIYLRLVGTLLLLLGVCIVSVASVASAAPKARQRFKGIAMDIDNNLAMVNTKLVIFLDDDKIKTIITDESGHFDITLPYGETNNVLRFEARGSFDYNSEMIQLNEVEASDDVKEVKFGENYRIVKQRKKKNKQSRKQRKALKSYKKRMNYKGKRNRTRGQRVRQDWYTI